VHIVKVARAQAGLAWHTTLGKNGMFGMATLSEQLRVWPAELGRPVAAVNGDFYERIQGYEGRPRDLQIHRGELVTDPAGHAVFWIAADGQPRLTNIVSRFRIEWADGTSTPFGLNTTRPDNAVVLYTARLGPSTHTAGGTELTLEAAGEGPWLPLQAGRTYVARVREVRSTGNTPLSQDILVLSVGPRMTSRLPAVQRGTALRIVTETSPDLTGVTTSIGGGPTLVRGGKPRQWNGVQLRHPRTAIGWNHDYLFLVEVDGRQSDLSVGMTFAELADYLARLGCEHAMNLDGGGSATLWFEGKVKNRPSEGRERACPNALVVVDASAVRVAAGDASLGLPVVAAEPSPQALPAGALASLQTNRLSAERQKPLLNRLPGADLFADRALRLVRLEISESGLGALRRQPRTNVPATVRIGPEVFADARVHLKGSAGSFRPVDDKPSLTLKFQRERRWHGLRKVHLNNSVEDASYLREFLGSELFRAAGVPAPRVAHARVELNGRALGLYTVKEGFTEDFLAGWFTLPAGHMYDTDLGHDVDARLRRRLTKEGPDDQADRLALAAAAAEVDLSQRWQRLAQTLDIDRFLSFMAMEVMLGHRDGYCLARNNFRLYHDCDAGKLVFLPHGMDTILGQADLPWQPRMAGIVARSILETSEGRQLYRARFSALLDRVFQAPALVGRADDLVARLSPFLSVSEVDALTREAAGLKQRIVRRAAELQSQLAVPALAVPEFKEASVGLTGWAGVDAPPDGRLDRSNPTNGLAALHILAGRTTSASWRTHVLLRPGHYRFEGRVRVLGVKPLPFGKAQGAGLRVSGRPRAVTSLTGDSTWESLTTEFQVTQNPEDVELVCELRASAGEAWFAEESLRLARLP
jgi:hypothetical protein